MRQPDTDTVRNNGNNALYERFAGTILAYLCQQVANRQDAEDILLEVFLAAHQNRPLQELSDIGLQFAEALVAVARLFHQGAAENQFKSGRDGGIEHAHGRESRIVRRRVISQGIMHTCRQRIDAGALIIDFVLNGQIWREGQLARRVMPAC